MNRFDLIEATLMYSDRQDSEAYDNVENFIILTEARINRLLKTREQSCRIYAPTVQDQEYYPLPPDYAGMRDIQLDNPTPTQEYTAQQYNYMSPEQFNKQRNKAYSGTLYYTVIANQIQIYPCQPSGLAIELIYYQKVPPLTREDDSNWLSENHPDIYLAGMTGEISLFAKDYDTATGWFDRLKIAVAELDSSDELERWAGQSLVTRAG